MDERYDFAKFREIIRRLRAPGGCPWDREQTHKSLRPCLMEEAAETAAAIRIYEQTGNPDNLCEELGDVLLQVMMHGQIAEEEGIFTLDDIIDGVSRKMIRRHPHVFGDVQVDGSDEVLKNWDDIKRMEKKEQSWHQASELREIPEELPAMARAQKVLKKADKLYGNVDSMEESVGKLRQRLEELDTVEDAGRETILSDMMLDLVNISRLQKVNAEQALADKVANVIDAYENELNFS